MRARPLSPHMSIYRMTRYSLVTSFANRITGLVLSVGFLAFIYWLTSLARGARAYARAQVLHEHWAGLREAAEAHLKESDVEMEEDIEKAVVEAEFQLGRQESVAQLQRWYWRQSERAAGTTELERMRAVKSLEELQTALAQNIEPNLAVETACLRLEGLL